MIKKIVKILELLGDRLEVCVSVFVVDTPVWWELAACFL